MLRSEVFGAEKTHRQIASGGGSGYFFKSALLHPFPSSRRHVIRVDMPVPVDVIRVAFWIRVLINLSKLSILSPEGKGKFKITMR